MTEAPVPSRRNPLWLLLLLIALVVAGVVGNVLGTHCVNGTINVTASATVQATPDTANFQVSVNTSAATAASALDANNARMQKVQAALLAAGVTKANLQTSGLNVYQVTNNVGQVTGFNATNTLSVTTHHVQTVGSLVSAAVNAAGSTSSVNGVTFSVSNNAAALTTARAKAMANARKEASDLAKAGAFHVGNVRSVTDNESSSSPSPIVYGAVATAAKAAVPIQAGTQSVTVQVAVSYSIQN